MYIYNGYKHVYMYVCTHNKCKINSSTLMVPFTFARSLQWSMLKWFTKFLVGYRLNKLSSISHKSITKPYSKERSKTDGCNFQHHHIIHYYYFSLYFSLLHGLHDFSVFIVPKGTPIVIFVFRQTFNVQNNLTTLTI